MVQIFQRESIFYSKISSGGSLFIEKLVPGGNQFWEVHFYHAQHYGHSQNQDYITSHSQKSSAIVKEVILGIGVMYVHNSRVSSTNDLVP